MLASQLVARASITHTRTAPKCGSETRQYCTEKPKAVKKLTKKNTNSRVNLKREERLTYKEARAKKNFHGVLYNFPRKKRNIRDKRREIKELRQPYVDLNAKAAASGIEKPWVYKMALMIERNPIVAPKEPWEVEYEAWKTKWEEPWTKKQSIREEFLMDNDDEDARKKMGLILEKEREMKKRVLGTILTEDDRAPNKHGLRRKQTDKVFLIVKKPRSENSWGFPTALLPTNPTKQFREHTRDGLSETVDFEHGKYFMFGNHPFASYSYEFSDEVKKTLKVFGTKLFFYKGCIHGGSVKLKKNFKDHAWVTRDELKDYIDDPKMYTLLEQITH